MTEEQLRARRALGVCGYALDLVKVLTPEQIAELASLLQGDGLQIQVSTPSRVAEIMAECRVSIERNEDKARADNISPRPDLYDQEAE